MDLFDNDYGLATHPLRDALYAELHSRPFHVIPSPSRVTYLAVLPGEMDSAEPFQHFQSLYGHFGQDAPAEDSVCYEADFGTLRVRREKHMEFTSYVFVNLATAQCADPFSCTGLTQVPELWLKNLPGTVVAAFHVAVEDARQQPEPDLPVVKGFFEGMRLVGSSPQGGSAHVWTTFQLHSDGFGRFLIYNKKMSDSQLGRLTQRVMEIETYRLMALLGLPLARQYSSELTAMDRRLAETTSGLAAKGDLDERLLLGKLTDMAAWVEACRAQTTFRFSATKAYHELVLNRLSELREDEVSGHLTVTEFMTRRLTPAVRTCESIGERLENLSRRIDRVSDMMRTRVELSIQGQNQDLLASMDRRSRIQLMMQHTVEGLSVAAISYYTVGLLKFLMDALYDGGLVFDKSLALGISVPVVILLVWLATRKIHKRFLALATEKADREASEQSK
ncbi:MAG: DUF3422 family protein [Pontibacterium sp.]